MKNKWVEHVQTFAQDNNMTYGCALNDPNITKNYTKVVKKSKKQINEERNNLFISQNIELLKNKIKNMKDDDKPIIKMKVNSYNKATRDGLKAKYPNYWDKLFN